MTSDREVVRIHLGDVDSATREIGAQVLDDAALAITPKGAWCRGSYVKDRFDPQKREFIPAYCLMGALFHSTRNAQVDQSSVAFETGLRALNLTLFGCDSVGEGNIVSWNDSQRDKRKVIRALRRAARNLRAA